MFQFTESYLARKTLDLLYASQRSDLDCKPFPFARLPLELRMEVYRYALAGDCRRILVWPSDMTICQEDFDSHRIHEGEPWYGDKTHPHWQNPRSHFRSVRIAEGMGINTAILRTSHALHEEAEPFLYQSHEFDFYVDVFGVVPFFRSLSHIARQNIRCLTIHLHHKNGTLNGPNSPLGLVATSRYNLLDWGPACAYIAQNVRLREIMFHTEEEAPEDFQQLSWVQDLTRIKGLRKLTYYELKKPVSLENIDKMGPEDYDRLTTGISVRNQALVTYLKSQMLGFPSTTC